MQLVAGHPHTVGVKEVMFDVSKPKKRQAGFVKCILLVLEICSGGELFDYLMHTSRFSEVTVRVEAPGRHSSLRFKPPLRCYVPPQSRTYWRQLCEALSYAHIKQVTHRDIKPENLLLDSQFNLRVADWGLSAVQVDADAAILRTQCGTKAYMAPELLRRELYRGETADVWSAGVVLFIMLAGFPPFQQAAPGDWWYDRVRAGQYGLFWQAHERSVVFSAEAKDLLSGIFVADPARRFKVEDCLKHPWSGSECLLDAPYPSQLRTLNSGACALLLCRRGHDDPKCAL
jgi:serine/threonine protein kinase